jgi:hypothetical protein
MIIIQNTKTHAFIDHILIIEDECHLIQCNLSDDKFYSQYEEYQFKEKLYAYEKYKKAHDENYENFLSFNDITKSNATYRRIDKKYFYHRIRELKKQKC